ncbi:hypothetical protein P171DRAFT_448759 [Karstenula rhodostoma CBS 690.94]|uniref:Uncharacterized protein n=1 Tax=Karstenula rhodostoma CBS 690.94 TaxID=1392251 RepID=A0A9P4P7B6_9PLEO|nr:hypothetical protein P171DRAFT_448759 [Karstenula rhodostoma CBS 690.94]
MDGAGTVGGGGALRDGVGHQRRHGPVAEGVESRRGPVPWAVACAAGGYVRQRCAACTPSSPPLPAGSVSASREETGAGVPQTTTSCTALWRRRDYEDRWAARSVGCMRGGGGGGGGGVLHSAPSPRDRGGGSFPIISSPSCVPACPGCRTGHIMCTAHPRMAPEPHVEPALHITIVPSWHRNTLARHGDKVSPVAARAGVARHSAVQHRGPSLWDRRLAVWQSWKLRRQN